MKLLADTHVFLWYISADPSLPAAHRHAIENPDNEVFLSVASVWKVVIKHGLGKLPLPEPPDVYLPRQRIAHGIASLPVDEGTMSHLANLPPLHRDPFDRALVAQALQHDLVLLTVDEAIQAYAVRRLGR